MKTVVEIVDDVYELLDVPEVYSAMLSGDIFNQRKPDNYSGECIVVNSLVATGQQGLQVGVINVNVFAPDMYVNISGQDGRQPDIDRINAIATIVLQKLKDAILNNTLTEIESTTLFQEKELHEHFLNVRLRTNSINI